jgi:hypothetical protein
MKSWVGIVLLTSDDLALPAIVKLLRDPKIPVHVQDNILDLFNSILEPVMSKVKNSTRSYRQEPYIAAAMAARRNGQMRPSLIGPSTSVDGKVVHMVGSNSDPDLLKAGGLLGRTSLSAKPRGSFADGSGGNTGNGTASTSNLRQQGLMKSVNSLSNMSDTASQASATSTSSSINHSTVGSSAGNGAPSGSHHRSSTRGLVGMFAQAFRRGSANSTSSGLNLANLPSDGIAASGRALPPTPFIPPGSSSSSGFSSGVPLPPPHTVASGDITRKRPSVTDHFFSSHHNNSDGNTSRSSIAKSNSRPQVAHPDTIGYFDDGSGGISSAAQAHQRDITGDFDPVYNLLENYTAILGCSFLHMGLIHSLFVLGVEGSMEIAKRSRALLISFLQVVATVLPENACADLLTNPVLIQLAVEVHGSEQKNSYHNMYRAHQSAQILIDLAEAFSLMPFKQTSGSHVSNLSMANQNLHLTSSSMGRHRTGSNAKFGNNPSTGNATATGGSAQSSGSTGGSALAASAGGNAGGMANGSISSGGGPAITQRANFQALNIKTLFELAEEIKISSLSTIVVNGRKSTTSSSVLDLTPSGTRGSQTPVLSFGAADALYNLRISLAPMVDKADFIKQMETSRIIGKEGKEPFKWDWLTTSDMLEYSFDNQACLTEALKTKWVRRLSGFYRCTPDEKGYFANLDWEPTHLQYLEAACNLYSVLLKDSQGRDFLTSDRRGMLFVQMTGELENVINLVSKPAPSGHTSMLFSSSGGNNTTGGISGGNSNGTNGTIGTFASSKCVFRPQSVTTTMAREFFALLGRIVRNPWSRRLLDNTNIFQCLSRIGGYRSLDYVSRVIATSLFYHDGGTLSKHILQFWTANGCSTQLKYYMHGLLRTMAQALSSCDPGYWCIDSIITQLMNEDDEESDDLINTDGAANNLYKAISELIHSKASLRTIISKRPRAIVEAPHATQEIVQDTLLVRFAAIPEGVSFLQVHPHPLSLNKHSQPWLDYELQRWMTQKSKEYVLQVEDKVNMALLRPQSLVRNDLVSRKLVEPIPIRAPPEYVTEMFARQQAGLGSAGGVNPNATLVADTRGFLRLPWHMEVKVVQNQYNPITGQYGSGGGSGSGADSVHLPGEYVRMDTFVDISEISSPLAYETTCDANRLFTVRAIVCDGKGQQVGCNINATAVIHSTLMVGICPVNKTGGIQTAPGGRVARRRSSSSNVPPNSSNITSGIGSSGVVGVGAGNGGMSDRSSMIGNARSSLVGNSSGNGNGNDGMDDGCTVMGGADFDHSDNPVTIGQEHVFEWLTCRAGHRQSNLTEMTDGRFAVTLPNEPIVFIFSRRAPNAAGGVGTSATATRLSRSGSLAPDYTRTGRASSSANNNNSSAAASASLFDMNRNNRMDASRAGSALYLVEIQYFFRLETGQSVFVPMPLHLYGELSRSLEGLECLAKRSIIFDTVSKVHTIYDQLIKSAHNVVPMSLFADASIANNNAGSTNMTASGNNYTNTLELRAALWSLAQIGAASEMGLTAILNCDANFIAWCIEAVCHCPYFSIRGTFFHVLGLLGRTPTGAAALQTCNWSVSGFTTSIVHVNNAPSTATTMNSVSTTANNTSMYSPVITTSSSRPLSQHNPYSSAAASSASSAATMTTSLSSMSTNAAIAIPHNTSILFRDLGTVGSTSYGASAAGSASSSSLTTVGGLRRAGSFSSSANTSLSASSGASAVGVNNSGSNAVNTTTANAGGIPTSISTSSLPALAASAAASAAAGGAATVSSAAGSLPTNATSRITLPTTYTSISAAVGGHAIVSTGQQLLKLSPVMTSSTLTPEQEVINLICKFPGNIMYKESKSRLENLRREHPQIFQSRSLFVTVMHLLDMFTFKLPLRREIVALFSDQAKRKYASPTASSVSNTVGNTSQPINANIGNNNNSINNTSNTTNGNYDAISSDTSSVVSTVIDDPLVTSDNTTSVNTAAEILILDQ